MTAADTCTVGVCTCIIGRVTLPYYSEYSNVRLSFVAERS